MSDGWVALDIASDEKRDLADDGKLTPAHLDETITKPVTSLFPAIPSPVCRRVGHVSLRHAVLLARA